MSHKETLKAHLWDMVRDERPDAEAEWKKTSGNDHFFHAMGLSLLARRVCEHVFNSNTSISAVSDMILGADWMNSSTSLFPWKSTNVSRIG